ncbi:uncharacterized transporter slc-17.2-like [Liolophura sinensis]|uniref:uncharacterized transporter slc-17.2-like n=1 Tax=Liolophura sinensis TaxID=3198878 RepID=UPI00315945AF
MAPQDLDSENQETDPKRDNGGLPGMFSAVRWRVAVCGFFGILVSQTFRVSFTVGVSCMVGSHSMLQENLTTLPVPGHGYQRTWNTSWNGNFSGIVETNSTEIQGEFQWDKKAQATLLSAYFYGYLVSQVPGGWLSRRYGTRWVVAIAMMVAMACTALTPICARTHMYLLFAIRVILGAVQGTFFPSLFNMAVRWVPPLETARFVAVVIAGFPIGQVVTFPVSGLLCQYGFDRGWGSIFYVFALTSLVWIVAWLYTVYDTPLQHPRISKAEREYIMARIARIESKQDQRKMAPWCSILASPPVWGTALGYFGIDWVNNTFSLGIILYMGEVLKFKITSSGIIGSLPPIVYFISSMFVGCLSDFILKKKALSRVNTRRLFQTLSFMPMGILMAATGFVTKEHASLAVAFLVISQMFFGLSRAGFLISVMDFAPRFAGEISGVLNIFGTMTGLFVPLAIGTLTPNGTQAEWRTIFLIGGGVAIIGAVGFCIFARGEVQLWAKVREVNPEMEIMVDEKTDKREQKTSA